MTRNTFILVTALLALGCGGGGSNTSSTTATPVPPSAPAFQASPVNQTALVGGSACFSVTCTGSGLSYLWQGADGATLGTQAAYTTPAVALSDDGKTFFVTVSNRGGSIQAQATLHVESAGTTPVILVEPMDITTQQGGWATFTVEAKGEPTPTVQWFQNGTAVAGATASYFPICPQDTGLDGASIHAALSNSVGSVTTRDAILHVTCATAPLFAGQPIDVTSFPGATASFSACTFTAATMGWVVCGGTCQAGSTSFALGGVSTTFQVSNTVSSGTSSTLSFTAPGTPGTYTVQAFATGSGVTLHSNPVTLTVASPAAEAPTLSVQGVLLDQGIQLPDGSVPLVANRPGLLRVIGAASAFNQMTPSVSVTVTVPGQAPVPFVIPAPAIGVPTSPDVAVIPTQTWDVMLPAALIQPHAQVSVLLDPGGQNVAYPTWSIPCASVPDMTIQFVPLVLAGGAPTLSSSDIQASLQEITRVHPLGKVVGTVGAPFTPSVSDISTVANVNRVLVDLETKRIADGASGTYYQGVWQKGLDCLYAGLGFIGSPETTSNRSSIVLAGESISSAHELGHNLGLQHAPCGQVMSPDPDFPYSGGLIGPGQPVDITGPGLMFVAPENPNYHDIMGYCGAFWISDYNYTKVFNVLARAASNATRADFADCLLVSGFQHGQGWELLPAFNLRVQPTSPALSGPRIDVMNGDAVVASQMVPLSDAEGNGMPHFVAAIPVPATPITGIRITHKGRTGLLSGLAGRGMAPTLAMMAHGTAHLSWNHATHAAAMVRDEVTGKVVAILGEEAQDFPVAPGHTYRVDLSRNLGSEVHHGVVPM